MPARTQGPLTRLILGTAHLSAAGPILPGSVTGAAAFALLDRALDLGIKALDTAAIYQFGGSERLIGSWMQNRGVRDRIYLITKGGHPSIFGGARMSRRHIQHDLDGSLRRLGVDYVDLYLVHRDSSSSPLASIAETLCSLIADGHIGAYGVSNWTHERFLALLKLVSREGMPLPVASSPQFSLPVWRVSPYPGCVTLGGRAAARGLKTYRATNTAVLAWSPLGGGWLAGPGGRAGGKAYTGGANDARYYRLKTLSDLIGCTPAQAALQYVLSHGSNVHAILGTRQPERLVELQAGLSVTLRPDQVAWLANGDENNSSSDSPLRLLS